MAALLPTILDRMVALIEGTATGAEYSITASTFCHVQWPVEASIEHSAAAPYPFELLVESGNYPALQNVMDEATTSRWGQADLVLRVGYAMAIDQEYTLRKTICEHEFSLKRTLTDPDSWDVDGWSGCDRLSWSIVATQTGIDDEVEDMLVLESRYRILYREDMS